MYRMSLMALISADIPGLNRERFPTSSQCFSLSFTSFTLGNVKCMVAFLDMLYDILTQHHMYKIVFSFNAICS
jgi:hypothetical protein